MDTNANRSRWPVRLLVAAVSIGLHLALLAWLLGAQFRHQPLPSGPDAIAVDLYVPPPPPPPPAPPPG